MTKKSEKPTMSKEEFNSYLGIDKQYSPTGSGSDTESSIQTDYGEITAPKSNPQLDYGGKRTTPESTQPTDDGERKIIPEPTEESLPESAKVVSPAAIVSTASVPIDPEIPSVPTAPAVSELPSAVTAPVTELPTATTAPTAHEPLRRPSTKQRKASFDEYRETFLRAPKISDRQPVFLSRETRDRLDEIVRKLGDRKMSVSGFLENVARHHLDAYAEDIEVWKRL